MGKKKRWREKDEGKIERIRVGRDVTERRPRALQRGREGGEDLHNKESPLIRERHAVIETQKNTRTTHKRGRPTEKQRERKTQSDRERAGESERGDGVG